MFSLAVYWLQAVHWFDLHMRMNTSDQPTLVHKQTQGNAVPSMGGVGKRDLAVLCICFSTEDFLGGSNCC